LKEPAIQQEIGERICFEFEAFKPPAFLLHQTMASELIKLDFTNSVKDWMLTQIPARRTKGEMAPGLPTIFDGGRNRS